MRAIEFRATLTTADGNSYEKTLDAGACDVAKLVAYATSLGAKLVVEVDEIGEFAEDATGGFGYWIDSIATPAQVAEVDPIDARMNELERAQRSADRKLDSILGLIEKLAGQPPKTAADWNRADADLARVSNVEGARMTPEPVAEEGGERPRRSRRRAGGAVPPEFHGDADHKSNSMGLVGANASPSRRPGGGSTSILTASVDAEGKPVIIETAPTLVGDTLKKGTR